MKLTYFGHACLSVDINGKKILFDPFISPNPLAKEVDVDRIEADLILLSHGHQDHVVDLESIANRTGATVVANYECAVYYGNKGLKTQPMNHGGQVTIDGITIKAVNAVHSSVLPDGTYAGNPMGFVVSAAEGTFYFAGDTALTWDMKLIPMICPKLDFAILPIGDLFTMGINDAVIAADFIACDKIVGCHYDTFEPIKIDKEAATKSFEAKGKTLLLPKIGEEINI